MTKNGIAYLSIMTGIYLKIDFPCLLQAITLQIAICQHKTCLDILSADGIGRNLENSLQSLLFLALCKADIC